MEQEKSLKDLLDSINSSIEDITKHPTKTEELPSNLEIMIKGVTSANDIKTLFSPKIDEICFKLLRKIESGDFESILSSTDNVQLLIDSVFGKGSFQGPISNEIISSISSSVNSYKFQTMRSKLGNVVTILKKKRLVIKNLERRANTFKDDKEQLKKYKDAVYAIKQVLKIIEKIYRNRKMVNKRVFNGINNIVNESN